MATPWASMSGLARRSSAASAVSSTASSSAVDVGALLGRDVDEHGVAAEFLGTRPYSVSCARIFAGSAPSLSILLTATTIGTSAACAWLMASTVCGMTPSSAATTRIAMSVALAPRARMAVNASWPGVSMKVIEPLAAVEIDGDLVGADVLGDAAGLFLADVGLADGVQQSGLAVVDVTHDGDHRRTTLQIGLVALVLAVAQVEGLQQLAVLVLGGHDLDLVVHLAAEQLQRVVADRLGGGDHLAEVEQRLHQSGRVGVDLLGEVGQRRAARQPDGLAVAVRQPHAADDRRLHVLVLGAFRPLRLAAALGCAAGTTERPRRAATLTGTTAAAGTTAIAAASCGCATATGSAATGSAGAVVTAAATTGTTAATGAAAWAATTGSRTRAAARTRTAWCSAGRTGRHVARRCAGSGTAAGARCARSGCLRPWNRPFDRLRRGERVVADARCARRRLGARRCGPGTRGRGRGVRVRAAGADSATRCRGTAAGASGAAGAGCCSAGAAGLGAGGFSGAGAFAAAFLAGAPLPSALAFGGGFCSAEGFAQPARDGGLHGGGCGFDEFALFTQSGEYFLAGYTEFFSQLVYAGLACHFSPVLEATAVVGPRLGFSYDAWSSSELHGVLMFFAACSVAGVLGHFECLEVLQHRGCFR